MGSRSISLLGSTGSIGRQTLEVAASLGICVRALSASRNISLLEEQVRRFRPAVAAVYDANAADDFRARVRDMDVEICSGPEGLIEAACVDGADTVVTAVVGMAGLLPTMAAIRLGRKIALANKETLVCAGEIVMKSACEHGAIVLPVDSEHSAILQCIGGEARGGEARGGGTPGDGARGGETPGDGARGGIRKIILTASGGPFREMSRAELQSVTPEMALRHPTWSMGQKVTIDSATLMNKGFEVIEAVHLFGCPPDRISVVIHPESIIHSMVEFCDNSVIAQLAAPDMRLPIQYALTYPERVPSLVCAPDFTEISKLTFAQPNHQLFPCLNLAIEVAGIGGVAGAILNGANEAAVELFIRGRLGFFGIYESVREALGAIKKTDDPSLEGAIMAGNEAKRFVFDRYG